MQGKSLPVTALKMTKLPKQQQGWEANNKCIGPDMHQENQKNTYSSLILTYSCLQNSCPHHLSIGKKLKNPKIDASILTNSSDSHLSFLVLYQALYDPMITIAVQR